jgi:hypothetical protein
MEVWAVEDRVRFARSQAVRRLRVVCGMQQRSVFRAWRNE